MTDVSAPELLLDTHQHLVLADRFGYAWTDGLPALRCRAFTLDDYRNSTEGCGIGRTLFMETAADEADWQDEARHVRSLADDPGNRIAGVIASCRPESDAAAFDAWLDETGPSGVAGYRRILHTEPDALSDSDGFVRNVREIGRRGKTFDLCFLQRQLPLALQLAERCDNTSLVLDHCGVPDIASGDFAEWRAQVRKLAALPHVHCKLSGVVAYCPEGSDIEASIRPYVEFCIEVFGADRCVWGSDWPVCNLTCGVAGWVAAFRSILAAESADARRAIYSANAERIYAVRA